MFQIILIFLNHSYIAEILPTRSFFQSFQTCHELMTLPRTLLPILLLVF